MEIEWRSNGEKRESKWRLREKRDKKKRERERKWRSNGERRESKWRLREERNKKNERGRENGERW